MAPDFLDWALADFSGYGAADERYDGPFCILSAVDNRCYKRLLYDVLEHDPTHEDIRALLGRLKTALVARGWPLCGYSRCKGHPSHLCFKTVLARFRAHGSSVTEPLPRVRSICAVIWS